MLKQVINKLKISPEPKQQDTPSGLIMNFANEFTATRQRQTRGASPAGPPGLHAVVTAPAGDA